jgi:hypothetical protein
MADLAMHEALVAIMRHRLDPGWAPAGMYYVVWPQANQLFHLIAYVLTFVCPTDVACKLVVAGAVLVAPVFMARALAQLQVRRWPALLVGALACGWTFRWGLVANLVGLVLLLFALPGLERLARRPSPRAVVASIATACLLFLGHESSAVLYAIAAAYFALVRSARFASLVARSAPTLATLALCVLQWRASSHLAGASMHAIGLDLGPDPIERIRILPGAIFGGFDATRLSLISGVFLVSIVTSAVAKGRGRRARLRPRVALWRHRYLVLASLFGLLFLTFPLALGGTTLLFHRFLPAACVCLIVACAPRSSGPLQILLAIAVPLTMLGIELRSFVEADRSYRQLDEILAFIPNDVAVAQLDLTPRGPQHLAPVPGAASRVQAVHGGRMLFAMTDMPPNPVYTRRDLQWNEAALRLAPAPYEFMPSFDAARFEYLLVRNTQAAIRPIITLALAPEEELVASRGEWALFHSRLPVCALDVPDRPLPTPAPETLAERLNRLLVKRSKVLP